MVSKRPRRVFTFTPPASSCRTSDFFFNLKGEISMRLRDTDEVQPDEAEMMPSQHARRARLHDEDDAATAG